MCGTICVWSCIRVKSFPPPVTYDELDLVFSFLNSIGNSIPLRKKLQGLTQCKRKRQMTIPPSEPHDIQQIV